MKKIKVLLAVFISASILTSITYAKDNSVNITYAGDAENFVQTTDKTNAFEDMMPGEEKVQKIKISNENYDSMKFFVKINDTILLDKQKGKIVYDISFKKDGEIFYTGRIGGVNQANKQNLDQEYLLKDLKKGESTEIEVSIKIDGTSMTDAYQGAKGNLGIVFSVEHSDDNKVVEIIKKIPVINKIPGVKTGDTSNVMVLAGIILGSFCMLLILVIKRRRGEEDEKA